MNNELYPKRNTLQYTQLLLASITTLGGIALLFLGFFTPPLGVISNSVLIAFGEVCTFAGGLLGIDYHYRYKS